MNSFNWLHLTDLHFGLQGQKTLWPNLREKFWEDLESLHARSGPWHAVLFTGDLVQSGNEVEFKELQEKVIEPLLGHLSKLGSKQTVLLAVPGNHDLQRPDLTKPTAAYRQMVREKGFAEIAEEFWSDEACEYRKIVEAAFANYNRWAQRIPSQKGIKIRPGILPGDFAASLDIPTSDGTQISIGIAGMNTTFLQLSPGNFKQKLSIDSKQLHHATGGDLPAWIKAHDACILMTHQGPDWLDDSTATEAYKEVNPAGRFAVHLFGHMHENISSSKSNGGGPCVRLWQGNSLFGLEKFGEPPQTERRHGYAAGRITFDKSKATICQWPRSAIKDHNGWRFKPDHDSCVLIESECCTNPERLECASEIGKCVETTGGKTLDKTAQISGEDANRIHHLKEMEFNLSKALEAFKGQPTIFLEPKLSKEREFNDDPNELHSLMEKPADTLIIAPPEFGLTCLGLHLQLEAFRKFSFWVYIDALQTKGRKVLGHIEANALHYNQTTVDVKCIIIDHWDVSNNDHISMVGNITMQHPGVPLIILSEDSLFPDATGNLSKLKRDFNLLHLQALSRSAMRKLVAGYNEAKRIGTEDVVLSGLAGHLEAINIHRTPLNCYTLLRVLDSGYNESLVNKNKLLKAILFLLFTDYGSFSHLSDKPEVEECAYILGCFCKDLVMKGTRSFDAATLAPTLREICKVKCIVVDIDAMISVLTENNILVKNGDQMAFRHRYWIFYFAAEWMRHDAEFRHFILNDRKYVNYPEIIEFYSGLDGKRADALEAILSDLTALISDVERKIHIAPSFDPLSPLLWDPSVDEIQKARDQIAEKVETSNLPASIKDKHADSHYQSAAPYDQSISTFLKEYSVLSLVNSIKAASRALRSSPFVDVELKHKITSAILKGWEEISRVVFWLSPLLAKEGRAIHDGFALMLADGFSEDVEQRFNQIITSNPYNVVRLLGDDLASKKIGPLLDNCFRTADSNLQKHMIALFNVSVRPVNWYDDTFYYLDRLHPKSFYLGDLFEALGRQVKLGDLEDGEELQLKKLTRAILSKREYAPKGSSLKEIPSGKLLNEENRLPIDKLLKGNRQNHQSG